MSDKLYIVKNPQATLHTNPKHTREILKNDSQLLFGETVKTIPCDNPVPKGWYYVRNESDHYQGFVHETHLESKTSEPTHFIDTPWILVYPHPDYKVHPLMVLPFLSRLSLLQEKENGFVKTTGGWVSEHKLKPLSALSQDVDYVETALKFLVCPYLYGGRTAQGIDCSGLVQISLMRSGVFCPRDSSDQMKIGTAVDKAERGDLIFFKGHVGIMIDDKNILNATSRTMDVRIEKLDDLAEIYDGIKAIKRL